MRTCLARISRNRPASGDVTPPEITLGAQKTPGPFAKSVSTPLARELPSRLSRCSLTGPSLALAEGCAKLGRRPVAPGRNAFGANDVTGYIMRPANEENRQDDRPVLTHFI